VCADCTRFHQSVTIVGLMHWRRGAPPDGFLENALGVVRGLFYVYDPDGRLWGWNDRLAEVTGYSHTELANMRPAAFVSEADREALQAYVREASDQGAATVEARLLTADRETIPYEFYSGLLRDDDGEPLARVGAGRDISDRRSYERELEARNERLDRFTALVAHDLRNPLGAAKGWLELFRESSDAADISRLEGALDRLDRTMDELLSLGWSDEAVAETEQVRVGTVATTALETIDTGPALVVEDPPRVSADRGPLRRLLVNLLQNSAEPGTPPASEADQHAPVDGEDAASDGPPITVRVGELDRTDGFYVADNGLGIPDDGAERVFDPGYTTADAGTGFGLSIVSEGADAHDGEFVGRERAAGGARFEFVVGA
jgi:PAS domain S-box-containing protein